MENQARVLTLQDHSGSGPAGNGHGRHIRDGSSSHDRRCQSLTCTGSSLALETDLTLSCAVDARGHDGYHNPRVSITCDISLATHPSCPML